MYNNTLHLHYAKIFFFQEYVHQQLIAICLK